MDDQLTLFKEYESQYCNKSTEVARKINGLTALSGDQRRRRVAELEYELKEAGLIIKRMETEAHSFAPDRANEAMRKVRDYKNDHQGLNDQLKGASRVSASSGESARKELGLGSDYFSTTSAQRDTMLKATERANKTSERLQYGRQQLAETEEIGVNILDDLSRQRETIVRATDTLSGAGENVGAARKILGSMSRRITTNKITLAVISLLIILAIFLVVYFKIVK